ncbi:MAG: Phosphoglycerate mutase [Thermotoga sp. 50_1627]|uniref:histidine phosphatase family protein n=1 Tax=Pseudothermotoga sp. TaxID=2033661 RepID=UPI00076D2AA2|nr:MAG: Phosphoglycerate mutase [Thermotoga sp. 50_64]KUK25896.1 MAG: Phosphoglycerate mutase [Thermotoga sp. 50_1627]MDK2922810.1 phosphoserine phosphatase [Pseudothermotoga sp.]
MVTLRIFLVRHARTDWNDLGLWQGNCDVPLNQAGFEEAQKIAERLSKQNVQIIYSSPLSRAHQTAKVIGEELKVPVVLDERLKECEISLWNGLTMQETLQRYEREYRIWSTDPVAQIDGVESLQNVQNRIVLFFNELLQNSFESVVVVSHALSLRTLICWVLKLSLTEHKNFKLDNASISLIEIQDRVRLVYLNDTCHLD